MKEKTLTTNAVDILHRRYYDNKPEREEELDAERQNANVSRTLYELRKAAGITQEELAKRVNTTPSVISRLENEGYDGHSLSTLKKIAGALGRRVRIEFVEEETDLRPA